MGHDILMYDRKQQKELAYLRFSMWNKRSNIIYDLLSSQDLNGGVSGVGVSREFTLNDVETALNKLPLLLEKMDSDFPGEDDFNNEYKREITDFLNVGFSYCEKHTYIKVLFA